MNLIMKEQLLSVLKEIRPDVDFESETALFTDGILDSFDIVTIVAELNSEFDIMIGVDDLEPENMDSIEGMINLIKELQD